jgi:hypothetical protein
MGFFSAPKTGDRRRSQVEMSELATILPELQRLGRVAAGNVHWPVHSRRHHTVGMVPPSIM